MRKVSGNKNTRPGGGNPNFYAKSFDDVDSDISNLPHTYGYQDEQSRLVLAADDGRRARSNSDCSGRIKSHSVCNNSGPIQGTDNNGAPVPARRHTFGTPPSSAKLPAKPPPPDPPNTGISISPPFHEHLQHHHLLTSSGKASYYNHQHLLDSRRRSGATVIRSSSDASDKSPPIYHQNRSIRSPQPQRRTSLPKRKHTVLTSFASASQHCDYYTSNDLLSPGDVFKIL